MGYEFKVEDALSFFQTNAIQTRQNGNELEAMYCPYCQGGSGRDKYTFSLNLEKGVFNCFRSSCGKQGHFVELCRDFGYELEYNHPRVYKTLPTPDKPIRSADSAVKYMESRGISYDITRRYEITSLISRPHVIVFPFFDEHGKLQFIKYRDTLFKKGCKGSKEWSEKDTMPILFGMKQCINFDRLIITEGQIDSLSVAQAGFDNACSVPTGAMGFTWFTPCLSWVNKFKELVVFGDWENGKMTLLDKLKSFVDIPVKAVRKQDYLGEKDANDILRKYGVKAIQECINNAEIPKVECVKDLSTVRSVNLNDLDKIETQIEDLDRTIGGMIMGQVILLTGKRGDGKSTFMSQLICAALDQGESVFTYSGELPDFHFKKWLDFQLAGGHVRKDYNKFGDQIFDIQEEVVEKISAWYRGRAFIYDNNYLPDKGNEFESLTETIVRVIKTYNTRLICVDNLMTAMDVVTEQNNLYLAQSNFVGTLKKIAIEYQVCIILVAHPRKTIPGEKTFDNDNVSGSSDITNKVDVVLSYGRAEENAEDGAQSILQVAKNRMWGTLKVGKNGIRLHYQPENKRIWSIYERPKHYGWENSFAEEEKQNFDFYLVDDDEDLPFE